MTAVTANWPWSHAAREGQRARRMRDMVLQRHGWTCHICLRRICTMTDWPWPSSLSVDHVVPIEHGGLSTLENLKPAHLRCNSLRGTLPVELAREKCLADPLMAEEIARQVGIL